MPTAAQLAASIQQDIDALRPTRLFVPPAGPELDGVGLPEAYKIQGELRRLREARGEVCCGYKVGCTSPTIQTTFGLSQPVHAYLWESERHPHQATLDAASYRELGIEGELGVYIIDSTPADVLDWAIEWGAVVELHHYVWDGSPPTPVELVSRNAIHAGVVESPAGQRQRGTLRDIHAESLCTVCVNGDIVDEEPLSSLNAGEGFPGGPLGTFTWLVEELKAAEANRPEDWARLKQPGAFVITSSPTGLYPVSPGDEVAISCCGTDVACTIAASPKL